MCVGRACRECTSWHQSSILAWTAGVRGMKPVQHSAAWRRKKSQAPTGMDMTRLMSVPIRRCQQRFEVQCYDYSKRLRTVLTLERREEGREMT